MTTATKSRARKPKSKPARKVRLYGLDSNPMVLEMTVGATEFCYFVSPLDADFGLAFSFRKSLSETDGYHVNLDLANGHHTCDCKGGTYNGHCKHAEALVALIQSGKLPQRPATPKPSPSTSAPVILPMPAPMKPAAVDQTRECMECGKPCTSIYCENCNGI